MENQKIIRKLDKIIIKILLATQKSGLNEEMFYAVNQLIDLNDELWAVK